MTGAVSIMMQGGAAAAPPPGPPVEPVPTFGNVSLLLHGDARPFIDSSSNKHPVCNFKASASLSGGEIQLGIVNPDDAVRIPAHSAFALGSGSWTFMCKVTANASNGARIFDTRPTTTSADGVAFGVQGGTFRPYVQVNNVGYGVGGAGLPTSSLTCPAGTKVDLCFCYDAATTTLRCFVGGVLGFSHVVALNVTNGGSNEAWLGNNPNAAQPVAAKLSELQLVKGEALFTTSSSYTPSARRADTGIVIEAGATPTFSNVKLLLHGNGANGSTAFYDASGTPRLVTRNGTPVISTAQSKFGGSSIRFASAGDFLSCANSADFWPNAGPFSVEGFVRPDAVAGIQAALGGYANGSASNSNYSWQVLLDTAKVLANLVSGITALHGSTVNVIPAAAWTHVCFARNGNLLMTMIEGELQLMTLTSAAANNPAASVFHLGRVQGFYQFVGYLDEYRLINGQCVYPRSFIVPTGPHPDDWRTVINNTADAGVSSTGWVNNTMRHVVKAAAQADGYPGLGAGGSKIRIKVRGHTDGIIVSKAYIGLAAGSGDAYDFAATPTQITWAGGATVSAAGSNVSAVSDEIPFTFDGTQNLVISMHFSGTTSLHTDASDPFGQGMDQYWVAGDSAATVNAAAGQSPSAAYALALLEVLQ